MRIKQKKAPGLPVPFLLHMRARQAWARPARITYEKSGMIFATTASHVALSASAAVSM
jgi:hypothetical protein